jgi:hypothetical protein
VFSFDLPPEEEQSGCIPTVSLILPGGNVKDGGIAKEGNFGEGPKTSFSQYFLGDFTNNQGNWSAVINNLKIDRGYGEEEDLAGPWVFHFDVP